MAQKINPQHEALQLLSRFGLEDIIDISISDFVSGIDIIYMEEPLNSCDGKIIFGDKKTIVKVDSQIKFEQRKRFVAAHEVGHAIMHHNMTLPDDVFSNFNLFKNIENYLKTGQQEYEANLFASELLMPTKLFKEEAKGKFSPLLIKQLSEKFNSSLTATAFKYMEMNLHPICLILTEKGRVKYWKKSEDLHVFVKGCTKLSPPSDSVAMEYLQQNYQFIYKFEEKAQTINKSTWFDLKAYDEDTDFYEYCIPTKSHQTILSIIWED
ncbi:ImmA/IrrE family metallo-endopeptidase [Parabacteroides sp. OttesenSCG-928-K15]|nr:ImmA/IrrE family metallo-endopeptidase [Parabacteroides sp. OttesenSCG-928-K15]